MYGVYGTAHTPSAAAGNPDSIHAASWDILQVCMLVYLSITLPLRSCFAVTLNPGDVGFWFDAFVDIVFILVSDLRIQYACPLHAPFPA